MHRQRPNGVVFEVQGAISAMAAYGWKTPVGLSSVGSP